MKQLDMEKDLVVGTVTVTERMKALGIPHSVKLAQRCGVRVKRAWNKRNKGLRPDPAQTTVKDDLGKSKHRVRGYPAWFVVNMDVVIAYCAKPKVQLRLPRT